MKINTPFPPPQAPPEKLAEAAKSSVSDTNGLFRLNYFNGRFLTAEALRKEQVYWDTRARLLAGVQPSGIAWGLGLEVDVDMTKRPWGTLPGHDHKKFTLDGRVKPETQVTLQMGLAFDGAGRPISVGTPFTFAFK